MTARGLLSSDFLSRMAERALGIEPVIKPRVKTLFEPAGATGLLAPADVEIGGETQSTFAAHPLQRILAPAAAVAPDRTHRDPPEASQHHVPSAPRPQSGARPEANGRSDRPPPAPSGRDQVAPSDNSASPMRAQPRDVPAAVSKSSLVVNDSGERTRNAAVTREHAPNDRQSAKRDGRSATLAPRTEPASVVKLSPPSTAIAMPKGMPAILQLHERRPSPRREIADERIVNVTIGRIDVRAALPAPATTQPRPALRPDPPQPLADYLKQRERER